jgi:hypothetical protein
MYTLLYNRLTGWLWFAIGVWSLFSPNIGDYIQLAKPETVIALGLGLLGMLGARSAHRNQVITCGILTISNVLLLSLSGAPFAPTVFAPTPFEGMLQFLCVLWGCYCLVQQLRIWIQGIKHPA